MRDLWKVDLDELFNCFSELSDKLFHADNPAVIIQEINMKDLTVLYNLSFIDGDYDIREFKLDKDKTTGDVLTEFNEYVHETYLKDNNDSSNFDYFVKEGLAEFDRFVVELEKKGE